MSGGFCRDGSRPWTQPCGDARATSFTRWSPANGETRGCHRGYAAHQQPPFTARACARSEGVANSPGSASGVGGTSADGLLDTYAAERREHVRRLTSVIKDIGRVICERDPALALARERMLAAAGGQVVTQARQELIPPLTSGLLSALPHPANGSIFPQPRVRQGAKPYCSTPSQETDFASSQATPRCSTRRPRGISTSPGFSLRVHAAMTQPSRQVRTLPSPRSTASSQRGCKGINARPPS